MKLVKRVFSATSAAVIGLSTLMTLGFTGVASAAGQTCVWTGSGGDTNFSTAGNWSGCGGGAPQDGDVISFTVLGSNSTYDLTNDLNVSFAGVTYGDSSQGGSNITTYKLSKLHLANNAVVTAVNGQGLDYSNVWVKTSSDYTAAGNLTLNGSIGSNDSNAADVAVQNLTVGNGAYANVGVGYVTNTYNPSGTVTITDGGAYQATGQETGIEVQNGGKLYSAIDNLNLPIAYGGGSSSANPEVAVATGSLTLNGAQFLTHNISANLFGSSTLTITGAISGNYTITKTSDSTGTLVINSSSNGSATPNGTDETPATTTTVSDSQPNATLDVHAKSTVILDGTRGIVSVLSGGTLKGIGTIQNLYVNDGGTVAPGHSPGKLTVLQMLQLNSGATYQAELQTKDAYDQLQVSDSSRTTGQDVSLGNATLSVSLYNGFKIAAGDTFTIINNQQPASQKVDGTFLNLPEGATFKVGDGVFKISYVGGDGNDVVLTVVTAPTTPDTGFAFVGANPVATLGVAVVAAGAILIVARKMRPSAVRVRATSRRRK